MYKAFNLKNISFPRNGKHNTFYPNFEINDLQDLLEESFLTDTQSDLLEYIIDSNILDANELSKDWFPSINADVFISHSGRDDNLAQDLEEWLINTFGLKVFLDTNIWNENASNDKSTMETLIDRLKEFGFNNGDAYAHAHMILNIALMKMIDKCEVVFFLNTPNSIKLTDKTYSPWLCSEIEITNYIKRKSPARKIEKSLKEMHFSSEGAEIAYNANLARFTELGVKDLNLWKSTCKIKDSAALDVLYDIANKKESAA